VHGTHADPSRVENSAKGLSCQLKFFHAPGLSQSVLQARPDHTATRPQPLQCL